ncbi:DNA-binding helix-turn-helix protein [[Clostridium] methylpentosum DSM 5476]|uniref:DNA-binding helix-turn-helix protein n=1 Tax=[Clostridium] methylpentosum DSM 5476 TaxID=537013 RepID=C0EDT1_9FIRM|nr:DNA-binding helix-turn-helix protein [[Clostridium] methylpentosum DSM 5476]MEE1492542.1 helix-turn-helix transcriptional regulator [Massilioclostridium sp.]
MYNTKKMIGEKINQALTLCNKKQKDLAKELQVADNTISYFVNGSRTPNTEQLIKIARFCNVSADWLLGLSEVQKPNTTVAAICDSTGLSETAVENLHAYQDYFEGGYLIPTINLLLEQATPPPDIAFYGFDGEFLEDNYNADMAEWESKGFVNLLSSIENYLTVSLNSDQLARILGSGTIATVKNKDGRIPWDGFIYDSIVTVKASKIIESTLLDDILEKLKTLKRNKQLVKPKRATAAEDFAGLEIVDIDSKEGALNGNDHETR